MADTQTQGRRNWSAERRAAEYARVHEWRERNREYSRRAERQRYAANAEALREAKMAAYWRDPEPFLARNLVRKARLIAALCEHGPKCVDVEFLRDLKAQACIYCGDPFQAADHFQPLAKGGLHCRENLVPACAPCNSSKKDRDPMEFLADRGLLA
jgi:5-methylcytosine-specific restriction endonuclease McrA